MPVEINAKYTVSQAAQILGSDLETAKKAEFLGTLLVFTSLSIQLFHPAHGVMAAASIGYTAFKQVEEGKMGQSAKMMMASVFGNAVKQAILMMEVGEKAKSSGAEVIVDLTAPKPEPAPKKKILKETVEGMAHATHMSQTLDMKALEHLMLDNPVKLSKAELLYQPVKGTDPNSTYYAVAISKDLKVGVRMLYNVPGGVGNYSVRVEGGVDKYKEALKKAHLSSSQAHASLHGSINLLDHGTEMYGAVIAAHIAKIGHHFPLMVSNWTPLLGKGA